MHLKGPVIINSKKCKGHILVHTPACIRTKYKMNRWTLQTFCKQMTNDKTLSYKRRKHLCQAIINYLNLHLHAHTPYLRFMFLYSCILPCYFIILFIMMCFFQLLWSSIRRPISKEHVVILIVIFCYYHWFANFVQGNSKISRHNENIKCKNAMFY